MTLATDSFLRWIACVLIAAFSLTLVSTGSAEAKVVKRWKTSNGYRCHKHGKPRINRHRGHVWPRRGVKSRVHCIRIKHRHRHRHSHHSSAWVLPRYVVMCESGGNARAVNYSNPLRPAGLYQIITPTWLGYGGGRFAATADRASVYHQGVIALRVLHSQGPRAWECW